MAQGRKASPFNIQRGNLDECLNRLKKYAEDPEWREVPGFEERTRSALEGARASFSAILEMVTGPGGNKKSLKK